VNRPFSSELCFHKRTVSCTEGQACVKAYQGIVGTNLFFIIAIDVLYFKLEAKSAYVYSQPLFELSVVKHTSKIFILSQVAALRTHIHTLNMNLTVPECF
jgi:hypothetical protein